MSSQIGRTPHYRDLIVWQKAMQFTQAIYSATQSFPRDEVYGLTSQLRRAAVSVPSNIAEGHGRLSDRSLRIFLAQARGSLYEVETQVQIASTLGYLDAAAAEGLATSSAEVGRLINGLLRTLRAREDEAS